MGLIIVFLIMLIVVLAAIPAVLYVLYQVQKKEHEEAQPDAKVLRAAGNKKVNLNTKVLIRFLEQADNAYIESYQRSNIEYFLPYCTVPLAMYLNNLIIYCNDKTFGLESHRKRSWTILEVRESAILIKKDITFDKIKERGKRAYITYADPIHEIWKVGFSPTRFQVLEVKDYA